MLAERRLTKTKTKTKTGVMNNVNGDHAGKNSAGATATSCPSETKLRCPCYCEENVWRLAYRRLHGHSHSHSHEKENEQYHVVFISNHERCCPMLYQKASRDPSNMPCNWDYHVILLHTTNTLLKRGKSKKEVKVLDIDSVLPYPCTLEQYAQSSFDEVQFPNDDTRRRFQPMFRVVRADYYLEHFTSDRSHMKRPDGTWMASPPTYDCIASSSSPSSQCSNLDDYIDMKSGSKKRGGGKLDRSKYFGEVMTMDQLLSKFSSGRK